MELLRDASGCFLDGLVKTASFQSDWLRWDGWRYLHFALRAGRAYGTSCTLDVDVSYSPDGGDVFTTVIPGLERKRVSLPASWGYYQPSTFSIPQITLPASEVVVFDFEGAVLVPKARFRFNFRIGGTRPEYEITAKVAMTGVL